MHAYSSFRQPSVQVEDQWSDGNSLTKVDTEGQL